MRVIHQDFNYRMALKVRPLESQTERGVASA